MKYIQRTTSYGEQHNFNCVERLAIRQRLKTAMQFLSALYVNKKNLKILEVGCGFNATNLYYLKNSFPEASFLGVDFRINKNLSSDSIELVEGDLNTWQPPSVYDCVLSLAVSEHLVALQQSFDLLSRSLSSDGVAILTTPKPEAHIILRFLSLLGIFDRTEYDDHTLYLTKNGIQTLARRSSLELKEYRSFQFGLNQCCVLVKYPV